MTKLPFRELIVWQKSVSLAKTTYKLTKKFPSEELFALTSQVRRSAVSVPSNIAEGSQRRTDKDFLQFLHIAKGSLAELETQILLAQELFQLPIEECASLMKDITEVSKILLGLIRSVSHSSLHATR
jgi:four helix bundle protein